MESVEYSRSRRRLWWVVVVPLVAVLAAAAWAYQADRSWSAVATVDPVLTGATGATGSSGGLDGDEYVSAFQALATGAAVRAGVVEATDASSEQLADGVRVAQDGDSTGLQVTYTANDRDQVGPVLEAVTRLTLERVFQGEVDQAAAAVERAQGQVTAADTALTEFGTRTGVADAGRAYASQLTQLNTLEARRVDASASGDDDRADELAAEVATTRETLATYVPLLGEYDALAADRDAAQGRLDDARERQEQAVEMVAAADPASTVFVGEPRQDSLGIALLRTAGVAGAVALVLCLLLASMIETLARTRAERAQGPSRRAARRGTQPATEPAREPAREAAAE